MEYYNTTTEPTTEPTTLLNSVDDFFSMTVPLVFTLTSMLGACIIFSLELFLYKNRITFKEDSGDSTDTSDDTDTGGDDTDTGDDDDDDEEDADELDIETYLTQYDEEYAALPEKSLKDADMVREQTPLGEVVMVYDSKAETYSYYTNVMTNLSFDILETVAKKYAIARGGAPPGSSNGKKEAKSEPNEQSENSEQSETSEQSENSEPNEQSDIESLSPGKTDTPPGKTDTPPGGSGGAPPFAKFKSYNTGGKGAQPNYSAALPVEEQTTHFRYKGKLADYEAAKKQNEKQNERNTLDYTAFKRMVEITDKMNRV
jgi:hypothetical protein